MLHIHLTVNAPEGCIQAVKETLAMYCERYGDTRIVSIKEELPQQQEIQFQPAPRQDRRYR